MNEFYFKDYLSRRKIYCISHNQYSSTTHSNLFFFPSTLFEVEILQLARLCWHENELTDRNIRQFDIGSGILQQPFPLLLLYDFYCNSINPIPECFRITKTSIRSIVSGCLHNNISKSHWNFLTFQKKENKKSKDYNRLLFLS